MANGCKLPILVQCSHLCPVFKSHVPATPVGIGMLFCRARASQVVGTRRKYPDLSVQHGLAWVTQ
jgi:hypothetical protein